MRNILTDELVADYMGIVAGIGRFRADWFLRFIGLDAEGRCRSAGRLHRYRRQSGEDHHAHEHGAGGDGRRGADGVASSSAGARTAIFVGGVA
jgi:hypothetical protein